MEKILVVEDDEQLNKSICIYLKNNSFEVKGCLNAIDALSIMETTTFDVIVSDIMMPSMDGFDLAREIRCSDSSIPMLFISAKDDIASKSKGFELGIDDYLVKPFELSELVLRIKALLRRVNIKKTKKLEIGNLVMDSEEHIAYVNKEELPLTVREFELLYKLLSYPGKTFTRARLMDELWDYDSQSGSRTVDVYIVKLREKTTACDGFELITRHGLGYKAVLK